jgi:hypothetical protein
MKRGKKSKKQKKHGGSLVQRALVLLTAAVLALCAASVTYGLFWRHDDGGMKGGNPEVAATMFRIEVLNGVGTQGLAGRAADGLRSMGIDVLKVGNAPGAHPQSILLARNTNPQIAMLGKLLNCHTIVEQLQDEPLVDATLILGEDYKTLNLGLAGDSRLH